MRIKLHFVGLLLIVASLAGCIATAPVIDADAVKNDGLLVGQVTSTSFAHFWYDADMLIDGELFHNAVKDGYVRLPLKPGTYEIKQISHVVSSHIGRPSTISTSYPVGAKFTIRAGEVTNLGKMVLYFPDKLGYKFRTFFVDNVEDMQAFLRAEHPSAYNALRTKEFRKADVTYANNKQIKALRTMMLKKHAKSIGQGQYLAGDLGTLAKVVRNKQGKIIKIEFVETGTYQNIGPCANENGRFACAVPHPSKGSLLYVTDKNGLFARRLPISGKDTGLQLIGKHDIVLVNNRMEVYTSMDNGKSWTSYTASRLETPLHYSIGPAFSIGKQGYYLYSRGKDATILYRKYGAPSYKVIEPPKRGEDLRGLIETDKGLYAGPEFTIISDAKMFFRVRGQNEWVGYKVPASNCRQFLIIDRVKDRIAAKCGNKYLVTNDHGKTWRQMKQVKND